MHKVWLLVLQCCVRLSSVNDCDVCIVAKRYVLEQTLLMTKYGNCVWGIDLYQYEWPSLTFIQRSFKPKVMSIYHCVTTDRKWPVENWMVMWSMTDDVMRSSSSWTRDTNTGISKIRYDTIVEFNVDVDSYCRHSAILATAWLVVIVCFRLWLPVFHALSK